MHSFVRLKLVTLVVLAACCWPVAVWADIKHIDSDELKALIDQGVPVIDIRREDEWKATGVIEGSHLMTFFDAQGRYDVQAWLGELSGVATKDEPFVLICARGVRTNSVANLLDDKLGYSQVHNVRKGIKKWLSDGKAVVPYTP